jgi:excisionase family DNA binding protein
MTTSALRRPRTSERRPRGRNAPGAPDRIHAVQNCTLGELVRTGQVPAAKVGRQWRFLRSQLTEWLAQGGGETHNRQAA